MRKESLMLSIQDESEDNNPGREASFLKGGRKGDRDTSKLVKVIARTSSQGCDGSGRGGVGAGRGKRQRTGDKKERYVAKCMMGKVR